MASEKPVKPRIIVILGPSGNGKTTVQQRVFRESKDMLGLKRIITCTTRSIRTEEIDGENYYFLTKSTFEYLKECDAFAETNKYGENYYGSLKISYNESLKSGMNPFVVLEQNGINQLRDKEFPVLTIGITRINPEKAFVNERNDKTRREEFKKDLKNILKADYLVVQKDEKRGEEGKHASKVVKKIIEQECFENNEENLKQTEEEKRLFKIFQDNIKRILKAENQ